jgi:hypothetical protein
LAFSRLKVPRVWRPTKLGFEPLTVAFGVSKAAVEGETSFSSRSCGVAIGDEEVLGDGGSSADEEVLGDEEVSADDDEDGRADDAVGDEGEIDEFGDGGSDDGGDGTATKVDELLEAVGRCADDEPDAELDVDELDEEVDAIAACDFVNSSNAA